jgi:hypothetical protein
VSIVFSEYANAMYFAQAAFVIWLLIVAIVMLVERRAVTPP